MDENGDSKEAFTPVSEQKDSQSPTYSLSKVDAYFGPTRITLIF